LAINSFGSEGGAVFSKMPPYLLHQYRVDYASHIRRNGILAQASR